MLKLGKFEYDVKYAEIYAGFLDAKASENNCGMGVNEFAWYIEIETDYVDFFDESTLISLYHNNGFGLPIKSWKELEGVKLEWDSPFNEKEEEAGTLYVFEHEDVTSGTIEILEREGNKFRVRWEGKGNVYWDEEYGEDVPFLFEGIAEFTGINVCCGNINSYEELLNAMKEFINMDEFELSEDSDFSKKEYHSRRVRFIPKL